MGNAGGKYCVQVYLHKNLASVCTTKSVFNAKQLDFKTKSI